MTEEQAAIIVSILDGMTAPNWHEALAIMISQGLDRRDVVDAWTALDDLAGTITCPGFEEFEG